MFAVVFLVLKDAQKVIVLIETSKQDSNRLLIKNKSVFQFHNIL